MLFGLVTALLRVHTESIYPPLAVHVAFNAARDDRPTFRLTSPHPTSRYCRRVPDGDANDPLIRQLREQLSDNDVRIVEALNARLKLVARLKRVKEERGIDFLDPAREEWMLQYLTRANRGPLSPDGLREIYTELLDLTKREVGRAEES